ncbi:TPA: hypothetical protein TUM56_001716 [Streptococcus equi subsp. zooepidemicus]|uniref:Mobilisation protein n=4 Tax=Streptococcus equi subsp. zooepidemicus TaxID=40041 RepID=A0A2X3X9H4_STRSZ|nr:hypothetical protein [Streptococcus equi]KIS18700.1 orf 10 protein [Streptococcus equi subsp. zooepidemicus Sz4is]VED85095.1 mobilisation protein [Streptococcus equi subsp. equi]HEL1016658.1 hypothetical protein [Streptococcus equi subsp. ruminatorum]KDE01999.1 orf 10 protein [Streptococcus equi subsp. zooepidemicus SzS31A1]KIQ75786.1 hypothetical protein QQ41_05675 [Streptococcus equi subsp. zooepidemicus]
MINDIRNVRREVKLTRKANKILEDMLRVAPSDSFSEFIRKRLLNNFPEEKYIENFLENYLKIELLYGIRNISRDIHKI